MRAYYALVDDILTWEEFEEAVYALNSDSCDEESEKKAAAEVVGRYGRLHPKISKLNPKPTLSSFFCKVIEKEPLRDFIRPDKSPGLITRILVGDDTGEAVLIFWDERAYAADDIGCGDVLEVACRFKNLSNINVADLRRSDKEISLRKDGIKSLSPCSLNALILELGKPLKYTGNDGNPDFKTTALVYDGEEFARIIVWSKDEVSRLPAPGNTVKVSGITPKPSFFREYSAGDNISFEKSDDIITPHFTKVSDIKAGEFHSLEGILDSSGPVLGYHRDDGSILWLKKGVLSDDTGSIPFVLWGRHAKMPVFEGDRICLYHCHVKKSEFSRISGICEIHAGYNSCVGSYSNIESEGGFFSSEGIVTELPDGIFLVSENDKYLLEGAKFKSGEEIEVSGILKGHTISVQSSSPVLYDFKSLTERTESLRMKFSEER